jgi:fatty-acyl-CoA synthase
VVLRPGAAVTLEDLHAHLSAHGWARWQLPDRVEIIDEVPRTSVGKFDKKVLRARFGDDPAAASPAGAGGPALPATPG